jgi:hypothetical protein
MTATSAPPSVLGAAVIALPPVALALAIAGGGGRVAIAPQPALLVAAAAIAAAALACGGRRPRWWLDLPVAALLGVVAAHVFLRPGLPFGHDTLAHLWGSWATAREVLAGDPHPRWLHHLGLGTPLLQFYGPLAYYALIPFAATGVGWPGVVAGGFVLFAAAAAMAMYVGVAAWVPDRRAALVAAAAYAFAPYRLLDSNYRMALGETAALALLPLVLLVTARRARRRASMVAPAVAIAALVLTHPLTAMLAALAHVVWLLAEKAVVPRPSWRELGRRASRIAGAWLLGGCLAGFFVLPVAAELRFTSLETFEPAASLERHSLAPNDLLRRRQWDELRLSTPRQGPPTEGCPSTSAACCSGFCRSPRDWASCRESARGARSEGCRRGCSQ